MEIVCCSFFFSGYFLGVSKNNSGQTTPLKFFDWGFPFACRLRERIAYVLVMYSRICYKQFLVHNEAHMTFSHCQYFIRLPGFLLYENMPIQMYWIFHHQAMKILR